MKIIITGGAGFIGSNAASRYLKDGHDVVVVDNLSRRGASANLEWLRQQGSLEFANIDIREQDCLGRLLRQHRDVDCILHLAGQVAVTVSVTSPRLDFEDTWPARAELGWTPKVRSSLALDLLYDWISQNIDLFQ